MTIFALAVAVLFLGGAGAWVTSSRPRWAARLGAGGAVVGSALGLIPAFRVLSGTILPTVSRPWNVPGGSFALGIDPLSAFFLVPIFVVGAATAVAGATYLLPESRNKSVGPAWLWFNVLISSMALVATARNGLLFLVAWEAMALSSFFLVVFHHEREGVPRAGWVYLVATHIGTAFLLVLFALLARDSGSLDFARWNRPETGATFMFVLAFIGFGSKAGLFPFHVWLPEAHPVAPSHVSALLSGVMIKLGIYGLLRTVELLGMPTGAAATVLVGAALISGVFGVLLALGQHDLKRVLAYHSVENVGIIALGLGLAGVAADAGHAGVAALALTGGLLHVWNHALFKSLLFLAAGVVGRSAGTQNLEQLGGLLRRMPWTGASFLLGAAAICALPPLNGFVSEFLIYAAAFQGLSMSAPGAALTFGVSIAGLALIGGLAAACFVKAAGVAFLGEPRSELAARSVEVNFPMRWTMLGLALACVVLGVAGPLGIAAALRPARQLLGEAVFVGRALHAVEPTLWTVGICGAVFALGALGLVTFRRLGLRRAGQGLVDTWDCGYAAPTARMQYSASSFAAPLTRLFSPVLRTRLTGKPPAGPFPRPASFSSHSVDIAERAFARAFLAIAEVARRLGPLEAGTVQHYVLYTLLATLGLLVWRLG